MGNIWTMSWFSFSKLGGWEHRNLTRISNDVPWGVRNGEIRRVTP